jgi:trimethylamine:corrinoid methyltransferase-like protein
VKTARFEVLSQGEIERIHATSMEILSEVGIRVDYGKARELFGQAGAQVDEGTHAVRISESLVQWALEQAPSSFTLSGHYLTEPHTRRHFRREHYIPRLLVREGTEMQDFL